MRIASLWALIATAFLMAIPTAEACVGCRAPGAKTEELTVTAGVALSWSVLFMLTVIGCVLAFLGWYIARYCEQLNREHARVLNDTDHRR